MSKSSQKKPIFAGLSTGVKLEQYARSILRQVQSMDEDPFSPKDGDHRVHIGVEPMLLALSMEFALKAWFSWDHDRHEPIRTHNLKKLFDALSEASKERLDREFRRTVAPKHPIMFCTDYSIVDVLDHHANAFVEWRYMHEKRKGGMSFNFSTFVATLELILNEFGKLYVTRSITPKHII